MAKMINPMREVYSVNLESNEKEMLPLLVLVMEATAYNKHLHDSYNKLIILLEERLRTLRLHNEGMEDKINTVENTKKKVLDKFGKLSEGKIGLKTGKPVGKVAYSSYY